MFCNPQPEQFSVLQASSGLPSVVGSMVVSTYANGVDDGVVTSRTANMSEADRNNVPEWIIVRELQYRKQGNLDGIASLYNGTDGGSYVRRVFHNVDSMKRYANRVAALSFVYRAEYDGIVHVAYRQVTQDPINPVWHAEMVRTATGFQLIAPRSGDSRLVLASFYPFWIPATARVVENTQGYVVVGLQGEGPSTLPSSAGANLLVRPSTDASIEAFVSKVADAYRSADDAGVEKLYDAESAKAFHEALFTSTGMRELVSARQFFKVNAVSHADLVIDGKDVCYIWLNNYHPELESKGLLLRAVHLGVGAMALSVTRIDSATATDALFKGNPDLLIRTSKIAASQLDRK